MRKLVTLILVLATGLWAHDLWFAKNADGSVILKYGHITHAHGGKKNITYNMTNVKEVLGFNQRGEKVNLKVENAYPLKIKNPPYAVMVVFSTGYWTKTVEGEKNLPKDSVEMPIHSWLSYEYVKYINRWSESFKNPLTDKLEVTPLQDITKVKKGDKVTFLVTLNKRPLKGVVVAYNGKPRGMTDEKGRINIRIREKGIQLISATYKEKGDGKKCDEIIHTATLNWEVK